MEPSVDDLLVESLGSVGSVDDPAVDPVVVEPVVVEPVVESVEVEGAIEVDPDVVVVNPVVVLDCPVFSVAVVE